MNEFELGFLIGSLITGIITTPFLMYFGIVYLNIRKIEKQLSFKKPTPVIIPDDETNELLKKATELLSKPKS